MKLIVPVSEDKKTIFKRTGKANYFNVYENGLLIDSIENHHAKHHHEHEHEHTHEEHSKEEVEHHRKDIQNLKGCDIIFVQALGPNMKEAIESIGLKVKKISKSDGIYAEQIVEKYLNGEL